MTIDEHVATFAGMPVREYDSEKGIQPGAGAVYRLRVDWEDYEAGRTLRDLLPQLLDDPAAGSVAGLIIGDWGGTAEGNDSGAIVEALVAARGKLSRLTALFMGEMVCEECEVSWINQSDMSPLWDAYPNLRHFRVRGGEGLSLGRLEHGALESLVIETGGLDAEVVREVAAAELPQLEHLELWLGTDDYGANARPEDLQPILAGDRFPKLRYLGLRNSYIADEIAKTVAEAPVVKQLDVLDLSLGTLTDEGAQALLDSSLVNGLKRLNLEFHYMSAETMTKFDALSVEVNVDDQQEDDEYDGETYRYVAVGE